MSRLALLAVVLVGGCAKLTAPPTPTSSCVGRTCRAALGAAAEALACSEEHLIVRTTADDRVLATGCRRQALFACEGRTCRQVGEAETISAEGEARYRAALALRCDTHDVALTAMERGYVARCRGLAVEVPCTDAGCASPEPTDALLYALRALEPEVLDCANRDHLPLDLVFDRRGHIVRVEGDDLRVVRLRGDEPHRRPGAGVAGCLESLFLDARLVDPARSGDTLRFYFGGSQRLPGEPTEAP